MANALAREITNLLAPALGDFIASATVKKNCELLGTSPDEVTADYIPALSDAIEKSVTFFSDAQKAHELVSQIRSIAT